MAQKFLNIAGAATTTVKSGRGKLAKIICNKAVATGVITIYDNTAASGTKIGTITIPAAVLQSQYEIDYTSGTSAGITFGAGLTIVTSAADDLTVVYE